MPESLAQPNITVWIDGVRLPDGCMTAPADSPTALTGLVVSWGRDTTIDQPSPASCTFDVLDLAGGKRFSEVLAIGSRLDVRATAQLYLPPTVETIAVPLAYQFANAVSTAAGRTITATTATDGERAALATVYPLPVSSNPTAWDTVPRALPNQRWSYRIDPTLSTFAGWLGAVAFEYVVLSGPQGTVIGAGSLPAGSGTFVPQESGWIGLRARWWPNSPAWNELDGSAWSALDSRPWNAIAPLALANISVLAPPAGTVREAVVFSGRITDMESYFNLDIGGTVVRVTAQDNVAELQNRGVGAAPWVAETLITRWNRIIAASGQTTASSVAASAQAATVTYRDVDNQPAAGLLAELAASVDGVLWSATHITTGPVLVLETMADRPPLSRLVLSNGIVVIVPGVAFTTGRGIHLSACSVDLAPIRWQQDISDLATRVAVQWKEQTLNDKGQPAPTDRTVTVNSAELETAIGVRRMQVSTQRTTLADATAVANQLLGRLSVRGWSVKGVVWDSGDDPTIDSDRLAVFMTLLDGTSRLSLPILLDDIPAWSPVPGGSVPLFLEGGRYHSDDGYWSLDLHVSSARAIGTGVKWNQLDPAWRWNQFDPAIRWTDLAGTTV